MIKIKIKNARVPKNPKIDPVDDVRMLLMFKRSNDPSSVEFTNISSLDISNKYY